MISRLTALLPFVCGLWPCSPWALAGVQEEEVRAAELQQLLAEAVDRTTREARSAAAVELAAREGVSLEDWLEAAQRFRPLEFEGTAPGRHAWTVDLPVLDTVESTALTVVVPEGWEPGQPAPLLVALHGSGGDGDSMLWAWEETARELGAILLAPTEAGPNAGFSGAPRERAAVLAAIRWVRRRFDVDENRIWLTGYSRGAHLTWDLALRFPDRFAAAAPCAGGPRFALEGGRNNLRFHENLAGLRLRALLGEYEEEGMRWNAEELVRRARKADVDEVEVITLPELGHELQPHRLESELGSWTEYFAASVRDPWAPRVVRTSVRADEASRHWLRIGDLTDAVEEVFQPVLRFPPGRQPDQATLRRRLIDQAEERTARVEAERKSSGVLHVRSEGAREVRLLLPAGWLPKRGSLKVSADGRRRSIRVEPEARVLLEEFVESFDRTFLPVAAVELSLRSR